MSLKNNNDFCRLKPYEKLETYGEKYLSTAELLAIIIKTGTREKNAIEISQEVLNLGSEKKNLLFLEDISIDEIKAIHGVGKVKAIQIKAVIELAKRIYKAQIIEKTKVKSTTDIVELFMEDMRYEKQEILKLIILNIKNEIIKIQDVCKGNTKSVIFDLKTILSEPVKLQAPKIILIHNHPSGDPTPSNEDIEATKLIKQGAELFGIKLLEHIIIGNGVYCNIN